MPSWNIHLAVAKQVNKKLKLNKNSFYLGNTIPDVDYGMKSIRKETHFYKTKCKKCPTEKLPDINLFLTEYKTKLNNPLIMGYYVHLLTDYFYNDKIFSKYWVQDEKHNIIGIKLLNGKIKNFNPENTEIRKTYKHHDLYLYGKYLFNKKLVDLPKKDNILYKDAKLLKNTLYEKEDLDRRLDYLYSDYQKMCKYTIKEKIFGLHYKMIDKKELDNLFNECIKYILDEIKKIQEK